MRKNHKIDKKTKQDRNEWKKEDILSAKYKIHKIFLMISLLISIYFFQFQKVQDLIAFFILIPKNIKASRLKIISKHRW